MPRSGTSWLGQIFDSSPDVAFRMEPLFSYQFKNIINERSSKNEIVNFFSDVYLTNDNFIHQRENRKKGAYDIFKKRTTPQFLTIKTTRHHNLLERYLRLINNVQIISIVRHPCAVINSWINTEREFSGKGCTEEDWRTGACRKDGDGEAWGFDDWLSVSKQHVALSHKFTNFNIVMYSDLIQGSEKVIADLFKRLLIPYTTQTIGFLSDCNSKHNDDPYSIFKSKDVETKWKDELDRSISEIIIKDTLASGLGEFLD